MNKFTSRPWKWVNKPFDKPFESRIPYITIRAGKGCFNQYDEKSGFEINGILSEADARLIASCPELLEACRSAEIEVNKWHSLNVVDNDKPNQDNAWKCLTKIRKAIKKAEEV